MKLAQFETTGSLGYLVILLSNKINQNPRPKLEVNHNFGDLTLLLFDSGVCYPFNKRNELK